MADVINGAIGKYSHREGTDTVSYGDNSHAEGENSQSIGKNSHAEGNYTTARGMNSHAQGDNTIAENDNMFVGGMYNGDTQIPPRPQPTVALGSYSIFEIGIGTSDTDRKNGLEVYTDGAVIAPELTINTIDAGSDKVLPTKEWILAQGYASEIELVSTTPEGLNNYKLLSADASFMLPQGDGSFNLSQNLPIPPEDPNDPVPPLTISYGTTGRGAIAFGENNLSSGDFSFSTGQYNTAAQFGKVSGYGNEANTFSDVSGFMNTDVGLMGKVSGFANVSFGSSTVTGIANISSGAFVVDVLNYFDNNTGKGSFGPKGMMDNMFGSGLAGREDWKVGDDILVYSTQFMGGGIPTPLSSGVSGISSMLTSVPNMLSGPTTLSEQIPMPPVDMKKTLIGKTTITALTQNVDGDFDTCTIDITKLAPELIDDIMIIANLTIQEQVVVDGGMEMMLGGTTNGMINIDVGFANNVSGMMNITSGILNDISGVANQGLYGDDVSGIFNMGGMFSDVSGVGNKGLFLSDVSGVSNIGTSMSHIIGAGNANTNVLSNISGLSNIDFNHDTTVQITNMVITQATYDGNNVRLTPALFTFSTKTRPRDANIESFSIVIIPVTDFEMDVIGIDSLEESSIPGLVTSATDTPDANGDYFIVIDSSGFDTLLLGEMGRFIGESYFDKVAEQGGFQVSRLRPFMSSLGQLDNFDFDVDEFGGSTISGMYNTNLGYANTISGAVNQTYSVLSHTEGLGNYGFASMSHVEGMGNIGSNNPDTMLYAHKIELGTNPNEYLLHTGDFVGQTPQVGDIIIGHLTDMFQNLAESSLVVISYDSGTGVITVSGEIPPENLKPSWLLNKTVAMSKDPFEDEESPTIHIEGSFNNVWIGGHAEGINNTAIENSHVEGGYNLGISNSHVEGESCMALQSSHAEGKFSMASGYAHVDGVYSMAVGEGSSVSGVGCIGVGPGTQVSGSYNISVGEGSTISGYSSSICKPDYYVGVHNNIDAAGVVSIPASEMSKFSSQNPISVYGLGTTAAGYTKVIKHFEDAEGDFLGNLANEQFLFNIVTNVDTVNNTITLQDVDADIVNIEYLIISDDSSNQDLTYYTSNYGANVTGTLNAGLANAVTVGGYGNKASNDFMGAFGTYNIDEAGSIFEIGIGQNGNRKNALTVFTEGLLIANEASTTLIDAGTGRTLVTKEWVQTQGGGSGVTVIDDLVTGGSTDALSAEQGKVLQNTKLETSFYNDNFDTPNGSTSIRTVKPGLNIGDNTAGSYVKLNGPATENTRIFSDQWSLGHFPNSSTHGEDVILVNAVGGVVLEGKDETSKFRLRYTDTVNGDTYKDIASTDLVDLKLDTSVWDDNFDGTLPTKVSSIKDEFWTGNGVGDAAFVAYAKEDGITQIVANQQGPNGTQWLLGHYPASSSHADDVILKSNVGGVVLEGKDETAKFRLRYQDTVNGDTYKDIATTDMIKQGVAVPDSTATDIPGLVADYNTLLASLRTAGIIAT